MLGNSYILIMILERKILIKKRYSFKGTNEDKHFHEISDKKMYLE